MKRDFRYLVLGLGGLGSGAAYWLARKAGSEVLGLEQFELGHLHGESQDHSRIIRLSYHTPDYVRLAQEAYRAWATVEKDAQEKLIIKTGGLDLWPPNAAIPMADYTKSLQSHNIPFSLLDSSEVMRWYPQFQLEEGVVGLYQSEGGIAAAAKCNAAHQRCAREYGATLLENVGVSKIIPKSGEVDVVTSQGNFRCERLVVAAGPWSNQALSHFEMKLPLTITQEQVTYFATRQLETFSPKRFPIWIWMDEPSFYGFPVYGEAAVKVGQDVGGREVTTETRTYEPDTNALKRVETFVKKYIPDAYGPILYTKSCLYTLTPDRDFVIDQIPGHNNCFITIGAGHAFKFASVIGKILSELAIDGHTSSEISAFQLARPILHQANPPKNFMV